MIVLTYGSDVDWVKNVLAAGGCGLRTRRRDIRLVDPRLVTDPSLPGMPLPVRLIGRVIGATELLVLREAGLISGTGVVPLGTPGRDSRDGLRRLRGYLGPAARPDVVRGRDPRASARDHRRVRQPRGEVRRPIPPVGMNRTPR